jgi:NitT/TauT family transport system permease protein
MAVVDQHAGGALDQELTGLDALELASGPKVSRARRLWSAAWPKLCAAALAVFLWQAVVWSGWKEEWVLPSPFTVFAELGTLAADGILLTAVSTTMTRAVIGYAIALVLGTAIGIAVARVRVLRAAFGSLITGLQTMPSIAWFPLALVLFQMSEGAIRFVVILGAAPAIANGVIAGVDNVAPILVRAGRVLGARGFTLYRRVILPASLPSFVGGLKQGWAFAWRSLMAGELLVTIRGGTKSIGFLLQENRNLRDHEGLLAMMLVILLIGIVVDALFFGTAERAIRRRWGYDQA